MSKEAALSMLSNSTPAPPATIGPDVVTTPPASLDSERFAKLAEKEVRLNKDREALKAEKALSDAEKVKLADYKRQIDEFEELKKTDKIAALKKIGFSEEDIFNFLAGKEEPKEPTAAELARIAAQEELEKYKTEQRTEAQRVQEERDESAIKAYKSSISDVIKKDAEKFEYCTHYGPVAEDIIYETILGFMADDQELTPHDAMKEAIEAVEKMYEEEDLKMSTLKKRQPKPAEPVKDEPLKAKVNERTPIKRPDPAPQATNTRETKDEKRERLMRKLSGA